MSIRKVSSHVAWRFTKKGPLNQQETCRILFAGSHFQGGYNYFRQILEDQQQQGQGHQQIELMLAPTTRSIMDLAPTAHVAIPFMEEFDASFFDVANELRLCIQFGVGLEGVNMQAATNAGVAVSNVPSNRTGNAQATSEHALYLAMTLLRNCNQVLTHRFQNQILGGLPIPHTLYKKNVTVVGYGNVGSVLCQYLQSMGAKVTVVRRGRWHDEREPIKSASLMNPNSSDDIMKANSLQEVLPTTQILFLACSMTPESLHLINEKSLSVLPAGALIINVGRGPLVEHQSILNSLKQGHIAGFASDVGVGHPNKVSEPWDPHDELSLHPNTFFTPHVGGYTDHTYYEMAREIMIAVQEIIQGRPPPVWVNRDFVS